MRISDILLPDHPCECSGAVNLKPVIKHLDLYVRPLDAVVTVRGCIDHDLGTYELAVFFFCNKNPIMSEISFFLHLILYEINRLFDLFKNAPLKDHILNHVHVLSNAGFSAVISDETDKGTREKLLRILPEQQNSRNRNLFLPVLYSEKFLILPQIFLY